MDGTYTDDDTDKSRARKLNVRAALDAVWHRAAIDGGPTRQARRQRGSGSEGAPRRDDVAPTSCTYSSLSCELDESCRRREQVSTLPASNRSGTYQDYRRRCALPTQPLEGMLYGAARLVSRI